MEFLKKLDLNVAQFLKLIGLIVIGLVTLTALSNIFGGSFEQKFGSFESVSSYPASSRGYSSPQVADYADDGFAYEESLSVRNVAGSLPPAPGGGFASGADAEAFEVKEYRSTIETRNVERDCAVVSDLKSRTEVIFENSNETDTGCNYTFKVENDSVTDVLATIEGLDPKELTESAFTIKKQINDYTSEVEILENKLASIDSTLTNAITAYDNITSLATRIQDVESLAKIIDSKITIIERLTNERIRTSSQLDRISRSKAEQIDRLSYTYFYVNMYENKFVDGEQFKNSWKFAVQSFVRDTNSLVQELTIGLVMLLLLLVKYAIYFFLLMFAARFGWNATKRIWDIRN